MLSKYLSTAFITRIQSLLVCLVLTALTSSSFAVPRHVYLTCQGDTSTTITVNFQTMEAADTSVVHYAINKDGKVFDVYPPDSRGAEDAEKIFLSLVKPSPAPPGDPVKK